MTKCGIRYIAGENSRSQNCYGQFAVTHDRESGNGNASRHGDDENHVSGTSAKKYVDDLLLTVPREKIAKVLEIFNQYHAGMQFTLENDGRIPTVRKTDQTVKTE